MGVRKIYQYWRPKKSELGIYRFLYTCEGAIANNDYLTGDGYRVWIFLLSSGANGQPPSLTKFLQSKVGLKGVFICFFPSNGRHLIVEPGNKL